MCAPREDKEAAEKVLRSFTGPTFVPSPQDAAHDVFHLNVALEDLPLSLLAIHTKRGVHCQALLVQVDRQPADEVTPVDLFGLVCEFFNIFDALEDFGPLLCVSFPVPVNFDEEGRALE